MEWIKITEKKPEKRNHPYNILLFQTDTVLAPSLFRIGHWNGEYFSDEIFNEIPDEVISHWCYLNYPG